jgi:hypothetical protein
MQGYLLPAWFRRCWIFSGFMALPGTLEQYTFFAFLYERDHANPLLQKNIPES